MEGVDIPENPWPRDVGTLNPEDSLFQEWIQIMEENRRKADLVIEDWSV
jgi:hypothetical protein